jgi:acyl-homoserine lactone acylase PvdQ
MRAHACTRAVSDRLPAIRGLLRGLTLLALAGAVRDRHVGGRRFVGSRSLAVLAVVAAGMCFPAAAAAKYSVSLTRTTGGVANVSGENFADVGFGIGYAQAQDEICTLAEVFLTVDGERSAFFGPEGTFKNEAEGACSSRTSTRMSTGPRSRPDVWSRSC